MHPPLLSSAMVLFIDVFWFYKFFYSIVKDIPVISLHEFCGMKFWLHRHVILDLIHTHARVRVKVETPFSKTKRQQ